MGRNSAFHFSFFLVTFLGYFHGAALSRQLKNKGKTRCPKAVCGHRYPCPNCSLTTTQKQRYKKADLRWGDEQTTVPTKGPRYQQRDHSTQEKTKAPKKGPTDHSTHEGTDGRRDGPAGNMCPKRYPYECFVGGETSRISLWIFSWFLFISRLTLHYGPE